MSLRQLQSRAGQFNKNAAQYHLGNREGLIAAIVETRTGPINERRWQMLSELDVADAALPRKLVEALICPLAQAVLNNPTSRYAPFLAAQAFFEPQVSAMTGGHVRADSSRVVLDRRTGSTGLPADLKSARVLGVFAMTIVTLANWESSSQLFGRVRGDRHRPC
jgi:AcrR family transcriptional regulator